MKKEIRVTTGVKKQLIAEGFGTYPAIKRALTYATYTTLARAIRQRAVQLGGEVVEYSREKVKVVDYEK